MSRTHELPYDPQDPAAGKVMGGSYPDTPLEALVSLAPFEDPATSVQEMLPIREAICDAIDLCLDPLQQWVFNACVIERRPLRAIADDLGISKSTVDRIKHTAVVILKEALEQNTTIRAHLERKNR